MEKNAAAKISFMLSFSPGHEVETLNKQQVREVNVVFPPIPPPPHTQMLFIMAVVKKKLAFSISAFGFVHVFPT